MKFLKGAFSAGIMGQRSVSRFPVNYVKRMIITKSCKRAEPDNICCAVSAKFPNPNIKEIANVVLCCADILSNPYNSSKKKEICRKRCKCGAGVYVCRCDGV